MLFRWLVASKQLRQHEERMNSSSGRNGWGCWLGEAMQGVLAAVRVTYVRLLVDVLKTSPLPRTCAPVPTSAAHHPPPT